MAESPEFLTVKEAAHKLRVHINHFYICLKDGRGPPHINSLGVIRIPADEFQKWVKKGGTKTAIKRGRNRQQRKGIEKCTA
jgi:hypothetical protein